MSSDIILVALDTETTDKYPSTAEIVQIAAVGSTAKGDKDVLYNGLCCPSSGEISVEASEIHGYYIEDLKQYPCDLYASWYLEQLLKDMQAEATMILVTYNGESYDLPILKRYGVKSYTHHIDLYRLV